MNHFNIHVTIVWIILLNCRLFYILKNNNFIKSKKSNLLFYSFFGGNFFILSMEADPKVEYQKGVQILLSPPKRGPKFVKDTQKRRGRTYTGDGSQAKGQHPRASERRSDGLLACFLLLSWRCGNRIAARLLRFLTLRWCKPEVRQLCWITHISKLKKTF
jgi:hypothetical protein